MEKCFKCMRAKNGCMCPYILPIFTHTHFVILMHPMEHKKEKNGTGRLTHLQLKNSEIIVDVDFTEHPRVNALLQDPERACFLLYPGKDSYNLSQGEHSPLFSFSPAKRATIFIIDATWSCAKKMLKQSLNLHPVAKLSFDNDQKSKFVLKQQPHPACLSTIESVYKVLTLFNQYEQEKCDTSEFLLPFEQMLQFQIDCIQNPDNKIYRGGTKKEISPKTHYKRPGSRSLFFRPQLPRGNR